MQLSVSPRLVAIFWKVERVLCYSNILIAISSAIRYCDDINFIDIGDISIKNTEAPAGLVHRCNLGIADAEQTVFRCAAALS